MATSPNNSNGLIISKGLNDLTFGLAGAMYGLAGILVLFIWRDSLACAAALLGSASGFAAGILLSPYEAEAKQFNSYLQLVGAFLSGFLLSKADRVFDLLVDEKHGLLIFNEVLVRRVMIAASCFLIATVTTFVARQYQEGKRQLNAG